MLLFGLKANSFCTNTTIEMTSFSISVNHTIGINGPSELTNHIRLCTLRWIGQQMAGALGLETTCYLFFFLLFWGGPQTKCIEYHKNHRAFSLQAGSSIEAVYSQAALFRPRAISTQERARFPAIAPSAWPRLPIWWTKTIPSCAEIWTMKCHGDSALNLCTVTASIKCQPLILLV